MTDLDTNPDLDDAVDGYAPDILDKPHIKVLDILLKNHPPTRYGVEATFLKAKPADCDREVVVPEWKWEAPSFNRISPDHMIKIDANGAYLAPVSGTDIAHDGLSHTGAIEFNRNPGYWLIDYHQWSDRSIIVSPLGNYVPPGKRRLIWLTTPTVTLLTELQQAGRWPDFQVYDSWTCARKTRANEWVREVREMRTEAIHDRDNDPDYLAAVKQGYVYAFQLMLGPRPGYPRRAGILRPDWYRTYKAAHAANTWRKAHWLTTIGIDVLRMREIDELTIRKSDWPVLLHRIETDPKAKLKIDQSGINLGQFKVKP